NMPGVASSATAVLIGQVAAATETMRVGSGGVMLPNHAPLVIAEQFGTLEALHPGRIDLGIGRAPGTDQPTARALRRTAGPLSADDFPEQLAELGRYFDGASAITATPAAGNRPPLWLLGSSDYSARAAGLLGLPFAFAHHFSSENTLPALRVYRESFRPSEVLERPYAMIAASVIVAADDDRAQRLAAPGLLSFLRLRTGRPGLLPSVEEAEAYPYTPFDLEVIRSRASAQIIGGPATVDKQVDRLLEETAADELMVVTMVHDQADRIRSYEMLAALSTTRPEPK
ncbi:MAG: LLM class flavin-dependent oxidoreductase, partial [Streptosporangiaceae bacterium]